MIIKDRLPCPNCEKGMLHIIWLQYDNPPRGKLMHLERMCWDCSYCANREIRVVKSRKAEIEPRRNMRVWRQ